MFEDTLFIIKAEYMHKRKPLLLKLLQTGFQIQGSRKLQFSPELAAEFLKDMVEDKNFMLQVILLSKGPCEAFILTKENAVTDLITTMVCYFQTSQEMDRNVHVTKFPQDVRHEITFIFPNYILEPVPFFQSHKFSSSPLIHPFIEEMHAIMDRGTDNQKNWRVQLAEWLTLTNKVLPHITNQCSTTPCINYEEKGQQVNLLAPPKQPSTFKPAAARSPRLDSAHGSSDHTPEFSKSSAGSSMMVTSSSCITCTCFDDTETCMQPPVEKKDSAVALIGPKMKPLPAIAVDEDQEEEHLCEHGFAIYGDEGEEGAPTKTFETEGYDQGETINEQGDADYGTLDVVSKDSYVMPGTPPEDPTIIKKRLQSVEIVPPSKDQIQTKDMPPTVVPEAAEAAPAEVPAEVPVEVPAEVPAETPAEVPAETPAEAPAEAVIDAPSEAPGNAEKPDETPAAAPAEDADVPPEG